MNKNLIVIAAVLFASAAAQTCLSNANCNTGNVTSNCCAYNSVTLGAGTGTSFTCINANNTGTLTKCMNATDSVSGTICAGQVICTTNGSATCYSQTAYSAMNKASSLLSGLASSVSGLVSQATAAIANATGSANSTVANATANATGAAANATGAALSNAVASAMPAQSCTGASASSKLFAALAVATTASVALLF